MQNLFKFTVLSALAAVFALSTTTSAEQAVVNEGKINVRGRPSLIGEVVTQLDRGDKVTILERIDIDNPKPGDPKTWAKIELPANVPAWVFAPFVKDNVVTASRLNMRGGPGDNYSILGRIDRGTVVKPVRVIEEWMEIEVPKEAYESQEAYAFIDASLVKTKEGEAVAVTTKEDPAATAAPPGESKPARESFQVAANNTATPPAQPPSTTPVQPAAEQPPAESKPAPAQPTQQTQAAPEPAVVASQPPAQPTPTVVPLTQLTPAQPLPQVAEPPSQKPEPALGKRIVRREGIVRPTKSIQAPTWYELIHPQTKVVINYLHEEKIGVNLKEFKDKKVVVSGEEAIDSRWPNTPIMEIETLDFAP